MRKLLLRTNSDNAFVSLPVEFIDLYMPEASAEALKVYLYLQRAVLDPSLILSVQDLSDLFDETPKKIHQALAYWEQQGLLSLIYDDDEITGITLLPVVRRTDAAKSAPAAPAEIQPVPVTRASVQPVSVAQPEVQPVTAASAKAPVKSAGDAPAVDLTALLQETAFCDLLSLAEVYLGHMLSAREKDTLATCYVRLWKDSALCEYLIETCIEGGHASVSYMQKVAEGWQKKGLMSKEDVEAFAPIRNKTVYSVMKELGLSSREPAPEEETMILGWASKYDLEVIKEACRRTIAQIHQPNFNYVAGILKSWSSQSPSVTAEMIAVADKEHAEKTKNTTPVRKNAFNSIDQRNTDYDSLLAN